MLKTTTANLAGILPEQIEQLVVLPVNKASVAIQAATLVPTDAKVTHIPRVTADPSASWVAEGDEIGATDPTIDDIEVSPAKLAGLTVITNELAADASPEAQAIVGDGLTRDLARKLDVAFFGSKGASLVQPAGLEDLAGITTITTAATSWTNVDEFAAAMSNAGGYGLEINSWVANPADALALAKLKEATGSNKPLLSPDPTSPTRRQIQGIPLFVSPAVTVGTIWGIPRIRAFVVRRNDVDLQVDKSAYFTSDRTAIRATMRVGFAFTHPQAIQKLKLKV